MADTLEIPRDVRDIHFFIEATLYNLVACYGELKKGVTFDTFLYDVMELIIVGDDPLLENVTDILMNIASEDDRALGIDSIASSPAAPIILAATYCSRAQNASEKQQAELAWSYMSDARYWCGVAITGNKVPLAKFKASEKAVLASRGRAGVAGRGKFYEDLRTHAYSLVRERCPSKKWETRTHAISNIEKDVRAYAEGKGRELGANFGSETLLKYLSEMPDKADFFQK